MEPRLKTGGLILHLCWSWTWLFSAARKGFDLVEVWRPGRCEPLFSCFICNWFSFVFPPFFPFLFVVLCSGPANTESPVQGDLSFRAGAGIVPAASGDWASCQ